MRWFVFWLLVYCSVVSAVSINELFPNPAGKDNTPMPGGEWLELRGNGEDVAGWYLKDKANHKLYVSDVTTYGTVIDEYLVVYANGYSGLLNNDGFEVIELYDSSDTLIDSVSYDNSYEDLSWSYSDGRWIKAVPTAGEENYGYEPPEDSTIEIERVYIGSDDRAKFGDIVRVRLNIYKGGTNKYAVYAKIPDLSKRTQVNLYNKYTNYTVVVPVLIYPNCKEDFEDDDYELEVSGLDVSDVTEFEISGINKKLCQEVEVLRVSSDGGKRFVYEVSSLPVEVKAEESFSSIVLLRNNYNFPLNLKIWSYVYRGSKSYSGEREGNIVSVVMEGGTEKEVVLRNKVDAGTDDGQYKFKVKINKNNQKTNQEITEGINVVGSVRSCPVCKCDSVSDSAGEVELKGVVDDVDNNVVYESSSIMQKKAVPVLLSLVGLLGIFIYGKSQIL